MTGWELTDWTDLARELHADAVDKGFWDLEDATSKHLAKMVSELGEIVNADREGVMYAEGADGKPEGVVAEMADFVMMVLDLLARIEAGNIVVTVTDAAGALEFCGDETAYDIVLLCTACMREAIIEADLSALTKAVGMFEMWTQQHGYDLEAVIRKKMAYNKTRPMLHGRRY